VSEESGQPYNYMAIYSMMLLLFILIFLTVTGIIVPLFVRLQQRGIILGPKRANHLLYFGCIGAGFMLFEIAMVQKFILFLGKPIYSLAVVLFSLLVFTGIGAWLSDRIRKSTDKLEDKPSRGLRLTSSLVSDTRSRVYITPGPGMFIAAIAALIVIFALLLTPLFNALIGLNIFWRCVLAIILLAPMGLLLGFPFPLGIRMLGDDGAELIPYAYGLNGALGVLGSVVSLILALIYGFSFSILIAVFLYLLAGAAAISNPKRAE
jgi:hypothetical protein